MRRELAPPSIWRSANRASLRGSAEAYWITPPRLLLDAVPRAPDSLGDGRVIEVVRVDSAADPEAVEVAIAHIAERDAIERLADLLGSGIRGS